MKNNYAILVALFIVGSTFAQAPEQMSYQAIVRDATGNLVTNQQVGMQISILQTTVGGTAVYVETQTPTTNANGLVSIAIGTGTPVNGTFATIDWSADTYFIKTETDPTGGTSYTITGTSQLLSVPYALHAKTVTQPTYNVNTFYAELGGYVIAVRDGGKHGLVVAMQDQGILSWYAANNILSNAINHDADGVKFMDWRLPTLRELNLMYVVFSNGNGASLNPRSYWSSTENEANSAWYQDFNNGNQYSFDVYSPYLSVRAVRVF